MIHAIEMDTADPIIPKEIEHVVDEVWSGDNLEQRYNYLDYHFECGGAYLRARVYMEEPCTAILFGPFVSRSHIANVEAPDVARAVAAYLERRFTEVQRR